MPSGSVPGGGLPGTVERRAASFDAAGDAAFKKALKERDEIAGELPVLRRILARAEADRVSVTERLRSGYGVDPALNYRYDEASLVLLEVATAADGAKVEIPRRTFASAEESAGFVNLVREKGRLSSVVSATETVIRQEERASESVVETLRNRFGVSPDRRYRYDSATRTLWELVPFVPQRQPAAAAPEAQRQPAGSPSFADRIAKARAFAEAAEREKAEEAARAKAKAEARAAKERARAEAAEREKAEEEARAKAKAEAMAAERLEKTRRFAAAAAEARAAAAAAAEAETVRDAARKAFSDAKEGYSRARKTRRDAESRSDSAESARKSAEKAFSRAGRDEADARKSVGKASASGDFASATKARARLADAVTASRAASAALDAARKEEFDAKVLLSSAEEAETSAAAGLAAAEKASDAAEAAFRDAVRAKDRAARDAERLRD